MHQSGINADDKFKKKFLDAGNDEGILFIQVDIDVKKEAFITLAEGKVGEDAAADFASVKAILKPKEGCFVLMKADRLKNGGYGKWLIHFYVPLSSQVKKKMLYASSVAALKEVLGANKFLTDYNYDKPNECTAEEYYRSIAKPGDEIMSWDERDKRDAEFESQMGIGDVHIEAVVGIPFAFTDKATAGAKELVEKNKTTLVLSLDVKKEEYDSEDADNTAIVDFEFPEREPRFIVHRYVHKKDDDGDEVEKLLFIYYCPDKSKPRLRMMYSSGKAACISNLSKAGLDMSAAKNFEVSEKKEMTEEIVRDDLYPKVTKKKTFKKAQRVGGGKKKFTGAKFKAK